MPNAEPCRPSILFIAGDVSGDVHTAAVASRLLAHDPNRTLHALGGRRLRKIIAQSPGGQFLADTTNCSAICVLSTIKLYLHYRQLRDRFVNFGRTYQIGLPAKGAW